MSNPLDPKVREAIERLAAFAAHARLAAAMSAIQRETEAPGAKATIFIGYRNPSGSGRTTAHFDGDPFCDDIETLIRALDPSAIEDDDGEAAQ